MQPPSPPLRCCLLSGGASRRMGRDKGLLPHPDGGTWLEHTLRLLAELDAPITLLSRWPEHLALARSLEICQLETIEEPPPWEGPLLALHRLMEQHPDEQLLLCPVDMPHLDANALETLVIASESTPGVIHVAHDGSRSQPLLGIYPSQESVRMDLAKAVEAGERRLQRWLGTQPYRDLVLSPGTIRNINSPEEL